MSRSKLFCTAIFATSFLPVYSSPLSQTLICSSAILGSLILPVMGQNRKLTQDPVGFPLPRLYTDKNCHQDTANTDDGENSVYRFKINADIKKNATKVGIKRVAVRQHCVGNAPPVAFNPDTENWGTNDLKFDPDWNEVTLNRCKKGKTRRAKYWTVHLCTETDDCGIDIVSDDCGVLHEICNEEKNKAIRLEHPTTLNCKVPLPEEKKERRRKLRAMGHE